MNTGESPLQSMFGLRYKTQLSLFVAEIGEVYPVKTVTGGAHQIIRARVGAGGTLFSIQLFDQPGTIAQAAAGSYLRVSASPNAKRAIVWEESKELKNSGTVVIRRNANVEVLSAAEAGMPRFRVAEPGIVSPPASPDPAPQFKPTNVVTEAHAPLKAIDAELGRIEEESRRFAQCLQAARQALGPSADPEDIRTTARVTYDRVYATAGR